MSHNKDHKAAFFRQSGWLMVANVVAGVMLWGVHFLAGKQIPRAEYGTVGALLAATILIPTIPLQMLFAREAAHALARKELGELAGKTRRTVAGLTLLWAGFALIVLLNQGAILEQWKISQPITLWLFLLAILASLVMPVFSGLLQGRQDFLWLGWSMISNGFGRLSLAALVVFTVARTAGSIMAGIVAGLVLMLIISMWRTRDLWASHAAPFATRAFLRQVVPLMAGFGACQFVFSADTIFVGRFFSGVETGSYTAAGTMSRALIWLVLPLATVMFPKLVHSAAKSEKSNVFGVTLASTAGLAIIGAIGLSVLGPFFVRLVYTPDYVAPATAILPWYAAAMVPLSLANVLVNNLLARSDFRIVPWLVLLAIAFGVTLWYWHPTVKMILQTLAAYTTALLFICAFFTWGRHALRQLKPESGT
jgi:O-antigen/teichoic acid export membrane protein